MGKRAPSGRMLGVALATSMAGSFHFGFQLVITNPAQEAFLDFMNATLATHFQDGLSDNTLENIWSFVVAIMFLGALAGSFSIRPIADKIGRKRGLYLSIAAGIFSGALSVVSNFIPTFALYIVSRVMMGWSVSVSLGLSAIFLSEVSPKECRGGIGMVTGACVQFGTVIGSIVAMPQLLGTEDLWYVIYIVDIAIMAAFACSLPFLPESPGYLVQQGADEAACRAIEYYHKLDTASANKVLLVVKEEQEQAKRKYTIADVLRKRSLRPKVFIGAVVVFGMSFSGISVVNAFDFEILRDTGLNELEASLANVGISIVSLISSVSASMVVDKFGRRPMLLIAFVCIFFCNIAIAALLYCFNVFGYHILGYLLILVICTFIVSFALGPGPLSYFISAELVGQAARSASSSVASVVQMLSRFALVAAFLPMKNALGEAWSYAILFIVPVAVSIVYLYFKLPETKNKDAKQVAEAMKELPKFGFCCGAKTTSQVSPSPTSSYKIEDDDDDDYEDDYKDHLEKF